MKAARSNMRIKHFPEIGAQYGSWTITDIIPDDNFREKIEVLCLCQCGTEKRMPFYTLVYGNSKKCRKCSHKRNFFKGYKELSKEYWTSLIYGAKARGIEFNLDIKETYDLFEKQGKKCALSGRSLILNVSSKDKNNRTASLDRIDSSKPYCIDNVQWVHKDVNIAKQSLSQNEFKRLCEDVTFHRNDDNDPDKWSKRFLSLAYMVSSFSKDPSTKVGAVITRDKKVIGLGYNGFPEEITDSDERLHNRDVKYRYVVHAELNAIANAGRSVYGDTIYVTMLPCRDCMKVLMTFGIKRIVYPYPTKEHWDRWGESFHDTIELAKEGGIELVVL